MNTGVDCNILVQLAFLDHPYHSPTLQTIESELATGNALCFPALVSSEFIHVVTDPRRFEVPFQVEEASRWLRDLIARSEFDVISCGSEDLLLSLDWLHRFRLGRKRILDTLLAATLQRNGVTRLLTSNPDDFRVFESFELVVP